jgi:hypothetical protein
MQLCGRQKLVQRKMVLLLVSIGIPFRIGLTSRTEVTEPVARHRR